MANRYLHQFQGAFYGKIKQLHAEFTVGASGAPTLVAAQSRGISSVTRNSAGKYTLALQDVYKELHSCQVTLVGATNEGLTAQVLSDSVSSSSIAFEFASTAITNGTANSGTITTPATAGVTDEEFVIMEASNGLTWGWAYDKTGTSAEPSDALWTAIPADRKAQVDISGDTTAAEVMDATKVAMNALPGFAAQFQINDAANDGTGIFTWQNIGAVSAPFASYLDDGSQTTGNVTYASIAAGTDDSVAASATDPGNGDTVHVLMWLRDSDS